MNNLKPLCYAPFIGTFKQSNKFAPCCVSQRWKEDNFSDFWAGQRLKNVRSKLLNQEWPNECIHCKRKTEQGLSDERKIWDKHFETINTEIDIDNGNKTGSPFFIDYRPTNKCNLKCRMCFPSASSQIESELYKNKELEKWFDYPNERLDSNDTIDEIANFHVKELKILGGEPLIDKKVDYLITKILEIKSNENLPTLRLTTNATVLNQKLIQKIKKFSEIKISFSIDAVENTYEYLRTGANWKIVNNNINYFFKNEVASKYIFNIVLTPYTIFNLENLINWLISLHKKGYLFTCFFDESCEDYTNLSCVLPEHMEHVKKKIFNWYKNNTKVAHNLKINELVDILYSINFDKQNYQNFIEYNNLLDKIRNTSIINIDNRFKDYI